MAFREGDSSTETAVALAARRGGPHSLLFHKQLVGRRLYFNAEIRFLVAAGIVAGALTARYVLGSRNLDVRGLMTLAFLLTVFNTAIFILARQHRRLERRASVHRFLMTVMHATIAVDFVFLTAALYFVGGAKSPFQAFYLIHVIVAVVLLSPRAACGHALFGFALLAGLVTGQWLGLIPVPLPEGLVNTTDPVGWRFALTVLLVQGMLMALSIYVLTTLTSLLRRGEEQLRAANVKLKSISTIQRDFLHIAVHDLKSPVSAAEMMLASVEHDSADNLTRVQRDFLDRTRARLGEAVSFLRDFEVLAELDATDIGRQAERVCMDELLRKVVADNRDLASVKGHSLVLGAVETGLCVKGVERLLREAVANLVTNAIKYTPENGRIEVRAAWEDGMIRIEVEDNGIGIAPQDQKRLFQEFVRIKRQDGVLGRVSGSGLGLSIVRRVIEANGGTVGVSSEAGKGSIFFIRLPVVAPRVEAGPGETSGRDLL